VEDGMQLEDYFDFLDPNDIRIKGTRAGIETVLYHYMYQSQTAEEIAQAYDAFTLEQVYATILYYLHNQEQVTKYMAEWLDHGEKARAAQAKDPVFQAQQARLRAARAARDAKATADAPIA
jgi:uncharacterized protein (DUF433 family)